MESISSFVLEVSRWNNDYINEMYYITVGDLNKDGYLELITSSDEGVEQDSVTHYYGIAHHEFVELERCDVNIDRICKWEKVDGSLIEKMDKQELVELLLKLCSDD